jgi:predicted dehydrogenase
VIEPPSVLRAAIVGLGQVASRFDEEPRPAVWSHAGAYLALPDDYLLAAGADPSADQRARFQQRCPTAKLFADPVTMLADIRPEVVSVCTPPTGRAELIERLLDSWHPRVMLCEKPLELTDTGRRSIVARCAAGNIKLLVNYVRRYQSTYRQARQSIADGRIGRVVSVTVRAPNRLWSIGSHAVNLLVFLAGETPTSWTVAPLPALEEGEPAANALFQFPSGAAGALITMGRKDVLLFEADVVGETGRIVVTDNGDRVTLTRFQPSPAFVGYRVPGTPLELGTRQVGHSPFIELVREAAALARQPDRSSTDGADALASESVVEAIAASCRRGEA